MKNVLAACVVAALSYASVFAETVILSEGGITNYSVSILSGKMLAVRVLAVDRSHSLEASFSKEGVTFGVTNNGTMNPFRTKNRAKYLVGPGTFTIGTIPPNWGCLFSYDILPKQGIATIAVTNSSDFSVTNFASFQIPAGKRMRILDGSFPVFLRITATNGVSTLVRVSDIVDIDPGTLPDAFEISGPCTVSIARPSYNDYAPGYYLTYYFVSDVVQAASQSIVSPAGSLVVVEKSTDLTNWYPAFFTTDQANPQSFFRLNISR